jgi:hypothetical protein
VALLDENNNQSEILISGRPVKFVTRLIGQETVDNITIGIGIRDKFGQDIYGTNSFHLKKKIIIKRGQSLLITYAFDEFNIGAGKYSFSIAVHTDDTHVNECFHWVDKDEFGCSKEKIREKGRKNNKARSLAIYLVRDLSGATCSALGDYFGGVSGAAITVRYNKIAEEMAEDKRLKRKVGKIKARIINI